MEVTVIPIVIGMLSTVTNVLARGLEDFEIRRREDSIKTFALLRSERILIKVLETWGDLLSLRLQWKTSKSKIIISCEFFILALADGFSLEFEWQQSPQVSRTLPSILADRFNAVVWIVLIRSTISNYSNSFFKPLRTVSSAPITIGNTVTLTLHSFLNSLARFKYFPVLLHSLIFTQWSAGTVSFLSFVNHHLVWSSGWD